MVNKVLAVFDPTNFSTGGLDYITRRNEAAPCRVKAFFIAPVSEPRALDFQLVPDTIVPVMHREVDDAKIAENINYFRGYCDRHGIEYSIHPESDNAPIDELLEESRFSDLMVIGMNSFFGKTDEALHDEYMHKILHYSECPVFLIPDDYYLPTEIFLSYDGSATAMYAIRQFCHLLPEMHQRKVTLVYAGLKQDLPHKELVEEYLRHYFTDLNLHHLDIDAKVYFSTWINDKEYALVVAGAFGRSGVSQAIKSSFLSDVLRAHKVPMFIAHK